MPQVVAAVLIGAGIAAGVKWLAKEMARAAEAARAAHEDLGRRRGTAPPHAIRPPPGGGPAGGEPPPRPPAGRKAKSEA